MAHLAIIYMPHNCDLCPLYHLVSNTGIVRVDSESDSFQISSSLLVKPQCGLKHFTNGAMNNHIQDLLFLEASIRVALARPFSDDMLFIDRIDL